VLAGLFLSRYGGRVFIDHPKIHIGKSVPIIGTPSLALVPESVKDSLLAVCDFVVYRTTGADGKALKDQLDPFEQDRPEALLPNYALVRPGPREAEIIELRRHPAYPDSPAAIRRKAESQYRTGKAKIDYRHTTFIERLDYADKLRTPSKKRKRGSKTT
jgi:hypothetical protein